MTEKQPITNEDIKQVEIKETVEVKGELSKIDDTKIPEYLFEITNALYVKDIVQTAKAVLTTIKIMDEEKKTFNAKVKEALKSFDDVYEKFQNVKKTISQKAIIETKKYGLEEKKINNKTGEVETVFDSQLPKGFIYTKGRTTIEFDETKFLMSTLSEKKN